MKFISNLKLTKNKFTLLVFLFLFIITFVVRLPSIPQTFDNDSGAIAYHARLILSGEPLYGSHHPGHHLPAVYYLYSIIFWIFGDRYQSVKIFLILWVWINSIIIFYIGETIKSYKTGLFAAIFFIILSSSSYILGDTGEIEIFANLPISIVILFWVLYIRNTSAPRNLFFIGIFSGISILFKPNYLTSLPAVLFGIFIYDLHLNKNFSFRFLVQKIFLVLYGVLLVFVLCFTFFYFSNTYLGLLQVFLLGTNYIGSSSAAPLMNIFLIGPILLARANMSFTIICLFSFIHLIEYSIRLFRSDHISSTNIFILITWLLFSIVSAGISRLPFPHYSILLLPAGSLLISFEISLFIENRENSALSKLFNTIGLIMIILIIFNSFFIEFGYFSGYTQYLTGQISLNEFIKFHTSMGPDRADANEIVDYIKDHTSKNDKLFLWTDEVEIYYLSGRRSSSNNIWPSEIDKLGVPERIFSQRPIYVILGRTLQTETNTYGSLPPLWLKNELLSSYHLETNIHNYFIYRKNGY